MFRLLVALLKRLLPQCEKIIDNGHSRAAARRVVLPDESEELRSFGGRVIGADRVVLIAGLSRFYS